MLSSPSLTQEKVFPSEIEGVEDAVEVEEANPVEEEEASNQERRRSLCGRAPKKNHVRANCPDNPVNRVKPAVHVVVGNLDKYESGEEDDFRQIRCFLTIRVEDQCSSQKSCYTTSVPSADPKERARMD